MNFVFEVNPNVVLGFAFQSDYSGKRPEKWVKLLDSLYEKYPRGCDIIGGRPQDAFWGDVGEWLNGAAEEVESILTFLSSSDEYNRLIDATKKYRDWLEREWNRKSTRVIRELSDIVRTELPVHPITVYVVEPTIRWGQYTRGHGIVWGHDEEWNNYSMVYLSHEYLHSFLPKTNVAHAVIELATDNELRLRLNGNGKYFDIDTRSRLLGIEKELLSNWREYLRISSGDIKEFISDNESLRD